MHRWTVLLEAKTIVFPTPESRAGDLSMPAQPKFLSDLFVIPMSKEKAKG